jgi:hypothetical protein
MSAFCGEHVAHRAARPRSEVPTFAEVDAATDGIGEVVRKYASLLEATSLVELEPVIQYNWKATVSTPGCQTRTLSEVEGQLGSELGSVLPDPTRPKVTTTVIADPHVHTDPQSSELYAQAP